MNSSMSFCSCRDSDGGVGGVASAAFSTGGGGGGGGAALFLVCAEAVSSNIVARPAVKILFFIQLVLERLRCRPAGIPQNDSGKQLMK